MGELDNSRRGTRAEYLARFALSRVGFVSPVPREEDRFGIDLFLHLSKEETREGRSYHVPVGPTLAFQIKSNTDDFTLKGDNVKSFFHYQMPFFVAHVDVAGDTLAIYHPTNRIFHGYFSDVTELKLVFHPCIEEANPPSSEHHRVYLYGPIASLRISDFDSDEQNELIDNLHAVLQSWCLLEISNLAFRTMGVPFMARPPKWEVNTPLPGRSVQWLAALQGGGFADSTVYFLQFITDAAAAYLNKEPAERALAEVVDSCIRCKNAASSWLSTVKRNAAD